MDLLSIILIGFTCIAAFVIFGLGQFLERRNNAAKPMSPVVSPPPPAAAATADECLNSLLAWFYHSFRGVPSFAQSWLRSLNDAAKKVTAGSNCEVLFEDFGTETLPSVPRLQGVTVELSPGDRLTIRGRLRCERVGLRLVTSERRADRLLVANYDAVLRDLDARVQVRVACIANELLIMGCLDERAKVNVELQQIDSSPDGVDEDQVKEAICKCLASAVTNYTLSSLAGDSSADGRPPMPVEEVFKRFNSAAQSQQMSAPIGQRSASVDIKLIRAQKLGAGTPVNQPYAVVELDEPAQKHVSTKGLNVSPYWDESFTFALNEKSEEILFEVYDSAPSSQSRFLGLALLSLADVTRAVTPLHNLKLQSRPLQKDAVSGTLSVELHFAATPPTVGKSVSVHREDNGKGVVTKTAATSRRPLGTNDAITPTKTTTVTVKSVGQTAAPRDAELVLPYVEDGAPSSTPPTIRVEESSNNGAAGRASRSRDRGGSRGSSFFGDLRDRLSLRRGKRTRSSRSVDLEPRSHDAHLSAAPSASGPPSRDVSESRISSSMRSRSFLENASAADVSVGGSKQLYLHSTLVVETVQNSVKKYFLIPPAMMSKPQSLKLMRRGRKLHIFNEHTFVAVRSRRGCACDACGASIGSSFAKQAYQCRDCQFLCHKQCHYKTDTFCPRSTVASLEMEYVWSEHNSNS